jgi:hypothetical protein
MVVFMDGNKIPKYVTTELVTHIWAQNGWIDKQLPTHRRREDGTTAPKPIIPPPPPPPPPPTQEMSNSPAGENLGLDFNLYDNSESHFPDGMDWTDWFE